MAGAEGGGDSEDLMDFMTGVGRTITIDHCGGPATTVAEEFRRHLMEGIPGVRVILNPIYYPFFRIREGGRTYHSVWGREPSDFIMLTPQMVFLVRHIATF